MLVHRGVRHKSLLLIDEDVPLGAAGGRMRPEPALENVMELPVLVTQQPNGFRAATGGPLDLTADGPTPDAAVGALRVAVVAKLQSGQVRTLVVSDAEVTAGAGRRLGENPLFDDWVQAVEEYRREHNTIPEAE
jgi:hypothetical protein